MSKSPDVEPGTERSLRSGPARNPRRRQRQIDTESPKTAPRRKRSKISESTFVPPRHDAETVDGAEEEQVNGSVEVPHLMNGDAHPGSAPRRKARARKESVTTMDMSIPLRGRRNSVKRATRGDGATVLAQNARYSVKLLPSTPKDLRKEGLEWRGSLGAGHHALAITRQRAYVWDYTAHSAAGTVRLFDVPFLVKPTEVLPFGALVTTGTTADIGLVLISATTGKVVFYESIERAASLGLFQERSLGIEGSIGSLFSGEVVADIVSAHHAGFVVTLSSGRIAQLTLRDAQGKPRILSEFLRANEQVSTGLFGSIKGLLGAGSWKRDVSAVHTRQLGARGQMQVISLTEKAELQIWHLDWSGQSIFKGTLDFREVIAQELQKNDAPELRGKHEHLTTLDFAIRERKSSSLEVATVGTDLSLDILLLIRAGRPDDCEHVMANLVIEGTDVAVPQLLKLHGNHRSLASSRPRLLLPKPSHTALVTFENAFALKELDESDANSPEAQLHASYIQPVTFEDSVHLKKGRSLKFVGAYEEDERSSAESAVIFVEGAGMVRVTVEEAALDISSQILRSTSPFISTEPASMAAHLANKAQALRALLNHVRQSYPAISNGTMWQLLWDAEKVAAAQQLWKMFQEHVAACDQNKRIATLLSDICAIANQSLSGGAEERASDDAVRSFFIHHLDRLDRLLTLAEMFLRDLRSDVDKSSQTKLRLVSEADDLWNTALESVFEFRNENAAACGILPDTIEDGILTNPAEYIDLPEPWTSTTSMLKAVVRMADQSRDFAREVFEDSAKEADALQPFVQHIGAANPVLLLSMCRIYQERIKWLASRPSERDRELSETLQEHFDKSRHNQFRELAGLAQSEAGMQLAERYKDMRTLTEMVIAEMQFSVETFRETSDPHAKATIAKYLERMTAKISAYFDRFGDDFATPYFDTGFSGSQAGLMLANAQENWEPALNKYLRGDPSRAKLCWINDVLMQRDFAHASESLDVVGKEQETFVFAKKAELSLARLSLLAAQEDREAKGEPHETTAREAQQDHTAQSELAILDIQDQLYAHLLPEIQACIDRQAELEIAMQKFGFKNQDLHALRQLLENYLDRILDRTVLSADELIDALTLLDNYFTDDEFEDHNLQGSEFFLALKALRAIAPYIPQGRLEMLLQLIWKRCYVYDNWFEIHAGEKAGDAEREVSDEVRDTAAWRTIYFARDQGLLAPDDDTEQQQPQSHRVRFLLPSECLGAGCSAEDLAYRWSSADLLDPILKDNKIHDEQLLSYVEDRRLDEWVRMCVGDVKKQLDGKAERVAAGLERERAFEEVARREDVVGLEGKGAGKKVNGVVGGGGGLKVAGYEPDEVDAEHGLVVDGDGDVDME
ncbi:Non-repetitive/WGA-negative nucleoporin C-terminal-domain-containing protein [Neohortaea acidophila]|uniref:Non-repetitive/WGA-negative nucleoporin C-terminal-domain-containing protein n=1 Tax=Neohortaea acidophila TaxID=245834 RepID=A0A6A6PJT3_9PEZI|nr:Non-repetitive/WGA-negative nucleoporin C-terminal-domain-containing protein [Neohortaea acidophila]KAF2479961.1 Non-repetitive/WGA-negative nucleoporin C-terminal-domain-containing protein [Neohortaea acidophila]